MREVNFDRPFPHPLVRSFHLLCPESSIEWVGRSLLCRPSLIFGFYPRKWERECRVTFHSHSHVTCIVKKFRLWTELTSTGSNFLQMHPEWRIPVPTSTPSNSQWINYHSISSIPHDSLIWNESVNYGKGSGCYRTFEGRPTLPINFVKNLRIGC